MGPNNATTVMIIDKDDYYKDQRFASFSGLKTFSKCETLYEDIFVTRTYEEPEHDYFVYGQLVDGMVSEPPQYIEQNFIQVERKVNPEDALKIEGKIVALQNEIQEKETQLNEKFMAKQKDISDKRQLILDKVLMEDGGKLTATQEKKLAELDQKMNDLTINRAENLDKTLLKGIESRKESIYELQSQLDAIRQIADKQQVTASVWKNAEETALSLKTHPYFANLEFNTLTSQQIFVAQKNGVWCKGKLDYIKLSPAMTKFYGLYKAKQISLEELQSRIREMSPSDLWAVIIDIKTCRDLELIEPYNTHYRGQLGFYQDLVNLVLLIPIERIQCMILVADKVSNEIKKAELFGYTQAALDELKPDVNAWLKIWDNAMITNNFVSAKEKHGMQQKCFTCSKCRFCPFSAKPGEPVMINGPRFGNREDVAAIKEGISTADLMLDY